MPATEVRAVRDFDGTTPIQDWLESLEEREPRAYTKCLALILELATKGNDLRRPNSDALRDGVRELRTKVGTVNYRLLYFFFDKHAACLSHGLTKEGAVPNKNIEIAIRHKRLVNQDSEEFTTDFEI